MFRGVAVLAASGLVAAMTATAGPALATSCAASSTADDLARADAVFVGTPARSGVAEDALVVTVSDVYQGEVPRSAPVVAGPGMDVQDFDTQRQYVFFVQREGDALVAEACGGTGPVDDRRLAELESASPDRAAYRPAPVVTTPSSAAPVPADRADPAAPPATVAGETGESDGDTVPPWAVAAVVSLVVAIVVAGPVIVRRRRRDDAVGPAT